MDNGKIIADLKNLVSEKRLKHIMNVLETAVFLAKIFGADEEKVKTASYLHDIAKEFSLEEMNLLTEKILLPQRVREMKALLHGPAGAEYAKLNYGIDDEIYNACFYHTFGRENMSLTEKIVFVSDMIEPTREFSGLENIRQTAKENLNEAVLLCINSTLKHLLENDKIIFEGTVKTRNFYIKHMEKNKNM